ncbi:MAG: ribonuclease P protein component [Pseudomonadota bacterium]
MQRLKTRTQFQAVLAGSTVARTAHFALHCAALGAPVAQQSTSEPSKAPQSALFFVQDVWIGAMVPKRWAKRAVTRNAIKRQIYTVSTDFESALPVAGHVVRLRAGFDRKQFTSATSDELKAAVRQELQQLFAKVAARPSSPAVQGGAS